MVRPTIRRVAGRAGPTATPSLQQTIVIALAAGRLARAISTDEITEPLRVAVEKWAADEPGPIRDRLAALVRCPVCVGWWTSIGSSLAWPGRMRVRRGIAVAGVQVLLTLVERLVSEQGRGAIHEADLVQQRNEVA